MQFNAQMIRIEDNQSDEKNIETIVERYNDLVKQLNNIFANRIDDKNINYFIFNATFTITELPMQIPNALTGRKKPSTVLLSYITVAGTDSGPGAAASVEWQFVNDKIFINAIHGLSSGVTYEAKFFIM